MRIRKKQVGITILLLGGALLMLNCREITTSTRISPDGSFTRTITVTGDSSDVFDSDLPLPYDDSWRVIEEGEIDTTRENYIYSIRKNFEDVHALNYAFRQQGDLRNGPARRADLRKEFWWFATLYRYRETYPQWTGYDAVPLQEYFSDHELQQIHLWISEDSLSVTGEDSVALEQKFFLWMGKNLFEETIRLLEHFTGTESPDNILGQQKPALWEVFADSVRNWDELSVKSLTEILDDRLGTERLGRIYSQHQAAFDSLEERMTPILLSQDDVAGPEYGYNDKNRVTMPGKILSTNADGIEGNTVSWDTGQERYFVYDFVMEVNTRVSHPWAWAVTGVVVLVLLSGIGISFSRRRRNPRMPEE